MKTISDIVKHVCRTIQIFRFGDKWALRWEGNTRIIKDSIRDTKKAVSKLAKSMTYGKVVDMGCDLKNSMRYFRCECPECGGEVIGWDDWQKGRLCIMGICNNCDIYILEEDGDWVETKDRKFILERMGKK